MNARCSICSDLFDFIQDIAATFCGHIFHATCLAQWLQQSETCPQCRLKVSSHNIIQKLSFDTDEKQDDDSGTVNNAQLLNQVESCKASLAASNKEKVELMKKITDFEDKIRVLDSEKQSIQSVLKRELKNTHTLRVDNTFMKSELAELRKKFMSFQNLKMIMENATKDVEDVIEKCREKPQVEEVRRELIKSDEERRKLKQEIEIAQKEYRKLQQKVIEHKVRSTGQRETFKRRRLD